MRIRPVQRLLSIALLASLGPATKLVLAVESPSAAVDISFVAKVPSDLPVRGWLVLRPLDQKMEPTRVAVLSQEPQRLRLPPGSSWEVTADLAGFWVQRKTLTVGAPDQPTHFALDLWAKGSISGQVKVKEQGAPLPRQVVVKTLTAPAVMRRPSAPQGVLECPVDKRGFWSCSLPAATFDLVISAEGFSPHYRTDVAISPGKTLSLGVIELLKGASVAGWVALEDGTIERGKCMARLSLLVAGGADLQSVSHLGRTLVEQEVRGDGFFQITGLAPGNYVLEVQQPDYPPARVPLVRVDRGRENFLREPLILRKPLAITFVITPPLDWLGHRWRARALRTTDRTRRIAPVVFEGTAGEDGQFTVADQAPGSFRVSVQDSLGNSVYSGEHQVESPGSAQQAIDIRLLTVQGSLQLGHEPLAATLWFGGRDGEISSKMESDRAGSFHGVLPREGLWRIDVDAAEPRMQTGTRAEVHADRNGRARVDLQLPNTRIFGRVVDEQGRPVPDADVLAQAGSIDQLGQADAAGKFEIRGLPAGAAWLGAEAAARTSGRTFVTLVEDRAVGPLELRLRPVKRLRGTVVSPSGPVVGAKVTILAADGGGAATTGMDGTFALDVPEGTQRIVAVVSAPGFALKAFDQPAEGAPMSLAVTDDGGTLEVALPGTAEDLMRKNMALVFFQNNLLLPGPVLGQWTYDQSQPRKAVDQLYRAPNLAAGEYRVCLIPTQLELSLPWGVLPDGISCDSGFLSSGTTLALKPGALH